MSTTRGIRHRLLTILLLGVLTSALTLAALVQLLSTTTKQRVERVHDGVAEEVDKIARNPASVDQPYTTWIGMRGGTWTETRGASVDPPQGWEGELGLALRDAATTGARVIHEVPMGNATLVMSAEPVVVSGTNHTPGQMAWVGFLVRPMPSLVEWQWIVMALAAATALLVATTAYAIVTVNRGAAALRGSLAALGSDLNAPIPRPKLRELSDVADGIARLAENLKRSHAEEERLGQELAQQERLAALGRVVAGVAHEVRNPLASIKLRLDLAVSGSGGAQLPPSAEKAIANASSEIMRLDRLVADLLVVAGRASGPRATGSLGALARARVEALAPWSAERGVSVEVVGDASAQLHADSLARAIDNLLKNAVDASARGGSVVLRVSTAERAAILRVEDRGPGVAAERVPELFEPFFTTKSEGTGLGLAISRAIARQHGGDVTYSRARDVTSFELVVAAEARPKQSVAA